MVAAGGKADGFYNFEPYDCTPGEKWEGFLERLMNYSADQVDDRGFSLEDHILDMDEGGAAVMGSRESGDASVGVKLPSCHFVCSLIL